MDNFFIVFIIVKILVEDEFVDCYDYSLLKYVIYVGVFMYCVD